MDFFLYIFEDTVEFMIASVPLFLVFLMLKAFKMPAEYVAVCLMLNLLVSIFFWVKLKDVYIALYQSVPYISGSICIWAENVLRKKREPDESGKDNS